MGKRSHTYHDICIQVPVSSGASHLEFPHGGISRCEELLQKRTFCCYCLGLENFGRWCANDNTNTNLLVYQELDRRWLFAKFGLYGDQNACPINGNRGRARCVFEGIDGNHGLPLLHQRTPVDAHPRDKPGPVIADF